MGKSLSLCKPGDLSSDSQHLCKEQTQVFRCASVNPVLGGQRQVDLWEQLSSQPAASLSKTAATDSVRKPASKHERGQHSFSVDLQASYIKHTYIHTHTLNNNK